MNYATIKRYDVSNWSGVNSTIFFSGCNFKCPGCFNKDAQDFNYGKPFTDEVADEFIKYAMDEHVVGVCVLGGEPFQQDLDVMYNFIKRLKNEVGKPIHIWSGYKLEELLTDHKKQMILEMCDTLVDGRFIEAEKDLTLSFRGSRNQRVIYLKNVDILFL